MSARVAADAGISTLLTSRDDIVCLFPRAGRFTFTSLDDVEGMGCVAEGIMVTFDAGIPFALLDGER